MQFADAEKFLLTHHRGVISTRRPDGATHSSIVVCGVYMMHASFVSVYPRSQKIANLRRDPNCTVLAVSEDWREYVVVEGKATLFDYGNTRPEEMREMLQDVYMTCSGGIEHPDWDEYQQAMIDQKAVIVMVSPDRVYGLLR